MIYQMGQPEVTRFRQQCLTMSIGKRINEVRGQLGLTQQEFGKLAGGVSKTAVSYWETGKTKPERDALMALQKNKGLSPEWIMSGKGSMFVDPNAIPEADESDKAELLAAWKWLLPDEKAEILCRIKPMAERNRKAAAHFQTRIIRVADRRQRQVNFAGPERRHPLDNAGDDDG